MSIPTGSGSEIAAVALTAGVTNAESVILSGVANHIYSIICITICETAGNAEIFNLYIDDNAGGNAYEILSDQALGANKTFIFNDRLVLSGTDRLCLALGTAGDVDCTVHYIDQDWS